VQTKASCAFSVALAYLSAQAANGDQCLLQVLRTQADHGGGCLPCHSAGRGDPHELYVHFFMLLWFQLGS
jgi:hypothetical protein